MKITHDLSALLSDLRRVNALCGNWRWGAIARALEYIHDLEALVRRKYGVCAACTGLGFGDGGEDCDACASSGFGPEAAEALR